MGVAGDAGGPVKVEGDRALLAEEGPRGVEAVQAAGDEVGAGVAGLGGARGVEEDLGRLVAVALGGVDGEGGGDALGAVGDGAEGAEGGAGLAGVGGGVEVGPVGAGNAGHRGGAHARAGGAVRDEGLAGRAEAPVLEHLCRRVAVADPAEDLVVAGAVGAVDQGVAGRAGGRAGRAGEVLGEEAHVAHQALDPVEGAGVLAAGGAVVNEKGAVEAGVRGGVEEELAGGVAEAEPGREAEGGEAGGRVGLGVAVGRVGGAGDAARVDQVGPVEAGHALREVPRPRALRAVREDRAAGGAGQVRRVVVLLVCGVALAGRVVGDEG